MLKRVFFFVVFGSWQCGGVVRVKCTNGIKRGEGRRTQQKGVDGMGANDELNIEIINTVVGQGQGSITQSNNNNNMCTHTQRDVFIPF